MRVDGTVSTVSDGVEIDDGDMTQWDSQTQLGSGLPLQRGGGGGLCGLWYWCVRRAGLCVP